MADFSPAELVSATSVARNLSSLLDDLSSGKREKIGILRSNKLVAVMLPTAVYERLADLEAHVADIAAGKTVVSSDIKKLKKFLDA